MQALRDLLDDSSRPALRELRFVKLLDLSTPKPCTLTIAPDSGGSEAAGLSSWLGTGGILTILSLLTPSSWLGTGGGRQPAVLTWCNIVAIIILLL